MYVHKVYKASVDFYGDVRTLVRGLPYQCPDDWEDVLNSLNEDSELFIIKEPDNPKDKHAIAAYLGERRIGYVSSSDCGKIWLYLTDEKMPCKFLQRYEASFKISFENPRYLYEEKTFAEIYKDKFGVTDQLFPVFEIPVLNDPKDKRFAWLDDKIIIVDLEKGIPDFRRKLASGVIIIAGRKNSKGEYCYYLPYMNNPIADIEDNLIKEVIDKYGFVIALPDVPMITQQGVIIIDLHVTFFKETHFNAFDSSHNSEIVFNLNPDYKITESMESRDCLEEAFGCVKMLVQDKKDFVEEEKSSSHVNFDFYNKIDKVTTELIDFVNNELLKSKRLLRYIHKHPYYGYRYDDIEEYKNFVKIFVMTDVCYIYKRLNRSIDAETNEGKLLIMLGLKWLGFDIDYNLFYEMFNPNNAIDVYREYREFGENLVKERYEIELPHYPKKGFVMKDILFDVDDDKSYEYMDKMQQFAIVLADVSDSITNDDRKWILQIN